MTELSPLTDGIVLTHFIVSKDVERSRRFYTEVLGGRVVFSGKPDGLPTNVQLSNSFIVISVGGGPTDDKPAVTLENAPRPRSGQQLPQHSGQRHPCRVRRMEHQGRRVSDAAEAASI